MRKRFFLAGRVVVTVAAALLVNIGVDWAFAKVFGIELT